MSENIKTELSPKQIKLILTILGLCLWLISFVLGIRISQSITPFDQSLSQQLKDPSSYKTRVITIATTESYLSDYRIKSLFRGMFLDEGIKYKVFFNELPSISFGKKTLDPKYYQPNSRFTLTYLVVENDQCIIAITPETNPQIKLDLSSLNLKPNTKCHRSN